MSITYAFDPQHRWIRTTVEGSVSVAEIAAHLRAVQNEPWYPCPALVDTRHAEADLSNADIRSVVARLSELSRHTRDARIAVVVPSGVAYGLVRMIGIMLEHQMSVYPFYDMAAAEGWLHLAATPSAT